MLFGRLFVENEIAVALDLDNAAAILLMDEHARISRRIARRPPAEREPEDSDIPVRNQQKRRSMGESDLMEMVFGSGGLPFNT